MASYPNVVEHPYSVIDDVEQGRSYLIAKDGKPGPVLTDLYNRLRAIQYGDVPDKYGWVTIVE
jgi:branched-chain amino acid aminotransferase